jgi:DNA invertase Pin-like site-specific DNA recombinase
MRAAIYLRVSTNGQTTDTQERELRVAAKRMGHTIVEVYSDNGISGAKGRNGRPEFDRLHRDAARRKFDIVMAWSVDRLGRSLQDLVGFLSELHALGIELYLHQQGLDTTTPAGKAMFQMLGTFAEFERALIQERVVAGMARAKAKGTKSGKPIGRPAIHPARRAPPTRPAGLACEPLLHSSVLVSRPFAAASVDVTARIRSPRSMRRPQSARLEPAREGGFESRA